jgi:tetratricopeptide (TPR) repeat protein
VEVTRDAIRSASLNGDAATCVFLAGRWLRDHPDDLDVIHDFATMLYKLMRYDEAMRVYLDAIERFPDSRWGLYNQVGRLHDFRGDYSIAELWYRKAIAEDPDESASYIFLGATQAQQGKLTDAEATFRRAVECAGWRLDEAHHKLGMVLRGQGRLSEAAEQFRTAIELDPKYTDAIELLRDVERAIALQAEAEPVSCPPNMSSGKAEPCATPDRGGR